MLEAMIARLLRDTQPSDLTLDAADALDYRKRSFQSTLLRLHSLEKRMSTSFSYLSIWSLKPTVQS